MKDLFRLSFSCTLLALLLGAQSAAMAEAPAGYYSSCEGKSGKTLLQQLCSVVGPHTNVGYDGLWDVYIDSDNDGNGKILDMYSTKHWSPDQDKCGNYKNVGDCFNREHSMPKSWFSEASPMKSDAMHVVPTDGKVNGMRSNFPYGECANGTPMGSNGSVKGLGRLGTCTYPGYNGKVFEPDDEYKGDFARIYFYMAAAYNDKIANWNSDQLAHNNYPVFTTWSVNMLLKWHQQDPVSQKERDRNEGVYKHQHNRNPFVDHPEMVDHIWGEKKNIGWSQEADHDPEITSPADGTTFAIGYVGAGVPRSISIPLRASWLDEPVAVSCTGTGFTVSTTSVPAVTAMEGTDVTVTVNHASVADLRGTVTFRSGTASATVTVTAEVIDGLPVQEATDVTDESFTAHWVNITGSSDSFTLDVRNDGVSISGYPRQVQAAAEQYTVTGLEPSTTYTYSVSYNTLTSRQVSVTTKDPLPTLVIEVAGDTELHAAIGAASEPTELTVISENLPSDKITVSVDAPFELSTDKLNWAGQITLSEGVEDSFYARLGVCAEGYHTTSVTATCGDFTNDETTLTGVCAADNALFETFEVSESGAWIDSYINGTFSGVAGEWLLTNVGVYKGDKDRAYDGEGVARFGKNATSSISTNWDLFSGVGLVSFVAKAWPADADATIMVQHSTDGKEWSDAGDVTLPRNGEYQSYSVVVNNKSAKRIRLQQTAGSRVLLDNIKATSYTATVTELIGDDTRLWDAWCADGEIRITTPAPALFTIYSYDGRTVFARTVYASAHLPLAPGIYLVVSADEAKKVVVK